MALDTHVAGVGLADAIGQVRAELEQALQQGEGSSIAFRSGPVELEFSLEFRSTGTVDGGVKVYVLSFGAKGEVSSAATSRLKVVLQPVDRSTGRDAEIGDVGTE